MSSNLSSLNKTSLSCISLPNKTPTTDLDSKEKSPLKEDEKKTNTFLFQSNPISTSSSKTKTSQHTQNDATTPTPSSTVTSLRTGSHQDEKNPLYNEEKKSVSAVSRKNEYIKPTQEWVDEQIEEIFGQTMQGGSKYLKKVLKETFQLLTKCYKISDETSKKIIAKMVSAKDKDGKTPMHYAIDRHSGSHIKVLLLFNAPINEEILNYAKENLPEYLMKNFTIHVS